MAPQAPVAEASVALPDDLRAVLVRMGLATADERPRATPLVGGVSSDIWRVDLVRGPVCIKRALSQLKVKDEWFAPIERNSLEVAWVEIAGKIEPKAVPRLLGHDTTAGLFVMEYLEAERFPLWKRELQLGHAEPGLAREVARRLVHIHRATARRADIARRFASDRIFHAIRLEPYLEATAARHADLKARLYALSGSTAATKLALVHGDVSPKNILLGPQGPVFLDAECAWYGDPAFDVAFCLNHLLLKCLWTPRAAARFHACFRALAETYLAGVTWEEAGEIERRAAHLLPALFLGRVDGKSPVEYLAGETERNRVRQVARALLLRPVPQLDDVRRAWAREIGLER